jgi:hypothetical protein
MIRLNITPSCAFNDVSNYVETNTVFLSEGSRVTFGRSSRSMTTLDISDVICRETNVSFIASLLVPSLPATVIGIVWTVVVDSTEGGPNRSLAHVGEKRTERIAPTVANVNASASIIRPFGGIWFVTSGDRRLPRCVNSGVRHSVIFAFCVSTRFLPLLQFVPGNLSDFAARTGTYPSCTTIFIILRALHESQLIYNHSRVAYKSHGSHVTEGIGHRQASYGEEYL